MFLLAPFLVFFLATGYDIFDYDIFLKQSSTRVTTGKIVEVIEYKMSDGGEDDEGVEVKNCFVIYQFSIPDGRMSRNAMNPHWCPFYYNTGDTAPIAFSIKNPKDVRIIPRGGIFWGWFLYYWPGVVFILVMEIIGVIYIKIKDKIEKKGNGESQGEAKDVRRKKKRYMFHQKPFKGRKRRKKY
ncbi:hypothetical protein EPA93_12855 [Ktedonosporobacter rubrisoli]|uniref:DUF3592 domain-containing protein n=1 Tax=Ktedonosporobacter rubrisoli TaxID=2509675 RepID=A0A4P6JQ05_KTERU|nr:hypothetical protein [Ktedonosporobacter rubrisoli]QBD76846.1 hypothetical protein EPA93_12855 [Ktedonosporobacter rubrisoli]